jgi:hypothetical protein
MISDIDDDRTNEQFWQVMVCYFDAGNPYFEWVPKTDRYGEPKYKAGPTPDAGCN